MRVDDKTFLYKLFATAGVLAVLVSLFLACGGDKSTEPGGPGNPSEPGVLLTGDENANAAHATSEFFSYNAPSVMLVDSTGLLANKISAVLDPAATIGKVNAILDSLQALICYMEDTSLFVTLLIPAASDSAQIAGICQRLRDNGAFLFAFPGRTPVPSPEESANEASLNIVPTGPAATNIEHLKKCLMPAAWNLKTFAEATPHKVSVIVSDYFGSLTPSPEIPSQRFLQIPGDVAYTAIHNGNASGNHGFHVAGILGATYDSVGTTGIHPGKTTLLEIKSLNSGGESWGEILKLTADSIPRATRSIVNTSLGYNDPYFNRYSPLERMLYALQWRALVNGFQQMFLHATSAGNDGDETGEGSLAVYNSPFCMAALMESEWDWISAADLSDADSIDFNNVLRFIDTTSATNIFTPLQNVVVVGCSRLDGVRTSFSNLGANVRMVVGDGILGPCVIPDDDCTNNFRVKGGTSQSTPQVAGLAAYLMNLDANLTPYQAKEIIVNCYDNTIGAVNAYQAVLSLDHGLANAPIRKALLEVGGETNRFDEDDLEAYLSAYGLMPARLASANQQALDYSRYDLNGDGNTGGSTTAKFDLTADNPPAYSTVTVVVCGEELDLDENALTDEQILKYYAYSSLYSGAQNTRSELFGCGGSGSVVLNTRRVDATASVVSYSIVDDTVKNDNHTNLGYGSTGASVSVTDLYICPTGNGSGGASANCLATVTQTNPGRIDVIFNANVDATADGAATCIAGSVGVASTQFTFTVADATPLSGTLFLNFVGEGGGGIYFNLDGGGMYILNHDGQPTSYPNFPNEEGSPLMLAPGQHSIEIVFSGGCVSPAGSVPDTYGPPATFSMALTLQIGE